MLAEKCQRQLNVSRIKTVPGTNPVRMIPTPVLSLTHPKIKVAFTDRVSKRTGEQLQKQKRRSRAMPKVKVYIG